MRAGLFMSGRRPLVKGVLGAVGSLGCGQSSACLRGTDRSAGRDEKIRLVLSPNQFYALIFGANSP
jgi:hypothetical protein